MKENEKHLGVGKFYCLIVIFAMLTLTNPSIGQKHSLRFYGTWLNDGGRVKIPLDKPDRIIDVGSSDFTIEFWMKTSRKPAKGLDNNGVIREGSHGPRRLPGAITGNFIFDRDVYGTGDYGKYWITIGRLKSDSSNSSVMKIGFGIGKGGTGYTLVGKSNIADDKWHHIACTREILTGRISIFVDGIMENSNIAEQGDISYRNNRKPQLVSPKSKWFRYKRWLNDSYLVIGSEKHLVDQYAGASYPIYPPYNGWLDEIRFSDYIRYKTNFNMPDTPFKRDLYTLAIYHLDEGAGEHIYDESKSKLITGKLHIAGYPAGPVWSKESPFETR